MHRNQRRLTVLLPGLLPGAALAHPGLCSHGAAVAGGLPIRHPRWTSRLAGTATALTGMALIAGWINA